MLGLVAHFLSGHLPFLLMRKSCIYILRHEPFVGYVYCKYLLLVHFLLIFSSFSPRFTFSVVSLMNWNSKFQCSPMYSLCILKLMLLASWLPRDHKRIPLCASRSFHELSVIYSSLIMCSAVPSLVFNPANTFLISDIALCISKCHLVFFLFINPNSLLKFSPLH